MHVENLSVGRKGFERGGSLPAVTRALAASLLIMVCMAGLGFAQNVNSGEIRGTVTDPSGAVIPGVAVTLLNTNTGVSTELVTNSAGLYDAVSILQGAYKITFVKEGFQKLTREGITLAVGAMSVDVQLTVGAAQQEVVVTGTVAALKTETAEQSLNITAETMAALPNVNQDWGNFVKLVPGATGAASAGQGSSGTSNPGVGMAINGTLPFYSSYLVDGASIRMPHSANNDSTITFENIAELQINTSAFSSQYGGGGDVFSVISKSGGNAWHGSAYDYFQNDALNARSFFDGQKGRQRYNNFGGAFSGPMIKNKMFFYFNGDWIQHPSSSTVTDSMPTAGPRNGIFDATAFGVIYDPTTGTPFANNSIPSNRFDPVAKNIQSFYLTPNLPSITGTNNYRALVGTNAPQGRLFGRWD